MGQRDLQASMTLDQDFPGKVTHCNHVTFISIAQWSVEEDNTKMGKKPKAKKDTAAKMKKPENVLRGKTTNPQTAFKLTIPGDCSCFCIHTSRNCYFKQGRWMLNNDLYSSASNDLKRNFKRWYIATAKPYKEIKTGLSGNGHFLFFKGGKFLKKLWCCVGGRV